MAVPTYPSAISLNDVQTEFGGANPISISEYYSGGSYVGSGTANSTGTTIPTSGQISFINFSGAVAWVADPTQPSVTPTYWHGILSSSYYPYYTTGSVSFYLTRTNDLLFRLQQGSTFMVLDPTGTKVFANTPANNVVNLHTSFVNPYYIYFTSTDSTNKTILTKSSNTGTLIKSSNIGWGADNVNAYIYNARPSSGTQDSNTSVFLIATSNTTQQNCLFTIAKVNATDMVTMEWIKSVSVSSTDPTSNAKFTGGYLNQNESSLICYGYRGSTNTCVVILKASDGSVEQSWQMAYGGVFNAKPMSGNNIPFSNLMTQFIKSNTGGNVASIGISNTSWRQGYSTPYPDVDYDGYIYLGGHNYPGNTSYNYGMLAKYNAAGTRQWQVRIRSVDSSNAVAILAISATNTRVAVLVNEYTNAYDGKKWYISTYGERRILYLSSASGNTGTFGRFILESNTHPVFGGMANVRIYTYTFSPRDTTEMTLTSITKPSATSNGVTFTSTTI